MLEMGLARATTAAVANVRAIAANTVSSAKRVLLDMKCSPSRGARTHATSQGVDMWIAESDAAHQHIRALMTQRHVATVQVAIRPGGSSTDFLAPDLAVLTTDVGDGVAW